MPKLRVNNFSLSLDGYSAGPDQSLENPLGVGGHAVHDWFRPTRTFSTMIGQDGGTTGIDDDFAAAGDVGVGATIMGRNMFGPVRGEWPDLDWQGWWGDNPPYHHDVFVLTHHLRPALPMDGGTTFHFTDEPITSVLERAFVAANGKDVRIAGGAEVIQQFLRAGLIDELHVVISPVLLGGGERFFANLHGGLAGFQTSYQCAEFTSSPAALHVRLVRSI